MRRFETAVIGIVLAVVVLGGSVTVLGAPWFTRLASARYSQWEEAGLAQERMLAVAEQVRAFTVDGTGALPEQVEGRAAFDAEAVSHLEDVHDVMAMARMFTAICAAIGIVWAILLTRNQRFIRLRDGLLAGAVIPLAAVVVVGIVGLVDFDLFFSAFHGVFFEAGTWTFPYDSLLIQLFPIEFWMASGVALVAFVMLFSAALAALGVWAGRVAADEDA